MPSAEMLSHERAAKPDGGGDRSSHQSEPRSVQLAEGTTSNQMLQRLLRSGTIRARLTVGRPGDAFEQEADRMAETVMRMPSPPAIQRKCAACAEGGSQPCPACAKEEEERVRTKQVSGQVPEITPAVEAHIHSLQRGGQPLPGPERAFFEPRFGQDFSRVRIHTGPAAAESARTLGAAAYTLGRDIVFDRGRYAPGSDPGRRLLAHELTHVVQQGSGQPSIQRKVLERNVSCRDTGLHGGVPGGIISGPDAVAFIDASSQKAIELAGRAESMLANIDAPDPALVKALKDRFNLDAVDPAHARRIRILRREFKAIAGFLQGETIYYMCRAPRCEGEWAYTLPRSHRHTIYLCNPFWNAASLNLRGSTLLHEAFHLWWNQVHDYNQPAMHNAHCFEQFALDLAGATAEIPADFADSCEV